jgi:hypothetical protein
VVLGAPDDRTPIARNQQPQKDPTEVGGEKDPTEVGGQ